MNKKIILALIFSIVIIIISIIIAYILNRPIIKNMKEEDIYFDEKLNIYLFWGKGCPHCEDLASFLNSQKDYKKYYNLFTFEVWNDKKNNDLMIMLSEELNEKITGVPYLIIGDKTFKGYLTSMDEEILEAIKEQSTKEHYDIYKKIKEKTN